MCAGMEVGQQQQPQLPPHGLVRQGEVVGCLKCFNSMPAFLFDVRIPRFLIQIVLFKQEMHAELSDELGLI